MNDIKSTLSKLMDENSYFEEKNEVIEEIQLDKIKPNPYQPRTFFDDEKIDELASSIKEHGVFQPIILKDMMDHYVIIAGERRYRACTKLGMKTIPAIVRMYEKSKMIEIALIENLQREDLSPVEEAKAYYNIIREMNYTQQEVALVVGKSRSYVTNMLGLLRLDDNILKLVDNGKISMGHARVLSKFNDHNQINSLAKKIVEDKMTVRDIEKLSKKIKDPVKITNDDKFLSIEEELKEKYNVFAKIKKDSIYIKVNKESTLEEIISKLTSKGD